MEKFGTLSLCHPMQSCPYHVDFEFIRYYRINQCSGRRQSSLAWRNATVSVPRASNKDEKNSIHTCNDLEDQKRIDNPRVDLIGLDSQSKEEASESTEQLIHVSSLPDKLSAVHLHILASEQWNASRLASCHGNYMTSATNLIHYLAIKSLDIEELKHDPICIGLLNLETINSHVLASVTAGIQLYCYGNLNSPSTEEIFDLRSHSAESPYKRMSADYSIKALLKRASLNRERLFGTSRDRTTHIMVTVGIEAAHRETLIPELLSKGTTVFRINCAHGDSSSWSEIIRRVKFSSRILEKPCKILMDLAGPKLRTGRLKPGPCVIKVSPKRTATGEVTAPAQIWLLQKGACPPPSHVPPDAVLFIDGPELIDNLEPRSVLRFRDARRRERTLKIHSKLHVNGGIGFVADCSATAYVHSGAEMVLAKKMEGKRLLGRVVDVPASEPFVRLRVGDLLIISRDDTQDALPVNGAHRITCPSGYLFDSVKPGEPIYFDDGKIEGVIQGTSSSEIVVSVTCAGIRGTKLGSDKSINIPKSNIRFQGLTSKDIMDLDFVSSSADMVGISFVRDVQDIVLLRRELEQRKIENIGIILKIETEGGFQNLPLLLLEAMKCPNPLGVMIARGDLAVECGWEKLAYLQEEIISICGAAHVPVIWATQVLESLVKSGVPTRAEITDVARGKRASCIMLNKGKNVIGAVSTLDAILCSNPSKINVQLKPLVL